MEFGMFENRLLDALFRWQPDFVRNRLKPLEYAHGDVLAEAGQPIEHAIFPRSGLISVVVTLAEGDRIEVAMAGPRDVVGGAAIFGATHHLGTALAQLAGRAWTMRAQDLMDAGAASAHFRALMLSQEQFMQAQAQQTAACNAKHTIMHRMCSWLLRARDISESQELLLTQESLAQMLGVQRASVSMFASQLQEHGIIQYRRGRLRINDAAALAARACECHAAIRQQRELLTETGETAHATFEMRGIA
jgi:CRP-like cAMP-binding protein